MAGLSAQGKGANTPFILESRGVNRAETMSSLLERHAGIKDLMDRGELVPDTMARHLTHCPACSASKPPYTHHPYLTTCC